MPDDGGATLDMTGRRGPAAPAAPAEAPRFGAPPPDAPEGAPLQAPAGSLMTVPLAVPIGNVLRVMPGGLPAPTPPGGLRPTPKKPAWQVSLDRALIAVGRFGEAQVKRYRAAPEGTKAVVLIAAGGFAILLLGLVIFLHMR